MPLDTTPTVRPAKSGGVLIRQRLMSEARKAGDREAARYLFRAVSGHRRGEVREPECVKGDWVDRCGW